MNFLKQLLLSNLRAKFVLPLALMMAVSMLMLSGYLLNRQSESFRNEFETSGETMIKMLAINAESGVLFESEYVLDELLDVLRLFEQVEFSIVTNLEGKILSSNGEFALSQDQFNLTEISKKTNLTGSKFYVIDEHEHELLILISPVMTKTEVVTRENLGISGSPDNQAIESKSELIGHITIGLSVDQVNQSIAEGRIAVIILSIIVLISAIIVVTFIVNAITKPIKELVTITDQVRRGDLSKKVENIQHDEIGHLAQTFNQMIDSLENSRDEIEEYNRTLEEKIIERTSQLEDAQAKLIQSEKMGAIGQLAAGVAHELNNPLGGILGYAQFTLEKLHKNVPENTSKKEIESYLKYVSDIETQARRCKAIVQNLLKFSRSSRSIDFNDVDINAAIEETIQFVEHQLKMSHISIETKLVESLPIIQGNLGQLQQVFTNLIINAMHASESGNKIVITTDYSKSVGEFSGAIEISVIDHGHGVSEENIKKIFEPFFTTKEIGKGTGLGLSVSYGIIRDHGGEILVKSEINIGTTFTIILPVQKKPDSSDKRTELKV